MFAIWSVIRQTQILSFNSNLRLLSVFLINLIGFPICLIISLYNRNFLPNGKPPVSINEYLKNNNKNDNK